MFLIILAFICTSLTVGMFLTKNMMLGYPSALFWAVMGGYCYGQATSKDWTDLYYLLFFACFGMVIFCAFAMYGLREKRDPVGEGDEYPEEAAGSSEDDSQEDQEGTEEGDEFADKHKPGRRMQELRERAKRRREGERGLPSWGRFK